LNARHVLPLAFAVVAFACNSADVARSQDGGKATMTSAHSKPLTDREKHELRGPVRSVVEERNSPGWTDADGRSYPEFKSWSKTEYDREGRTAATYFRGSSGEWVTHYSYGNAGQLLRTTIQNETGKQERETVYQYDEMDRLRSITDSRDPNNPIVFRYDSGRRSKIAIAQPKEQPEGLGAISRTIGASFEDAGNEAPLFEGGSAVTLYDEHDRPTEIQTRTANGEIMSRTLRVYDDQGRVIEEKQIMDDPLKMIPRGDQKKMFASGDVSAQELRDKLAEFLGGAETWSMKYTYDAQGRKSKSIQKIFNHIEMEVEMAYNQHGDVAKETNKSTTRGTPDEEHDGTGSSETIYSYEYDSYGNWTAKKSASRSLPDGTFKDAGEDLRRTIEYF